MRDIHHIKLIEDKLPPNLPLLKRVYAAPGLVGWAIQCLCFEFVDNSRRGFCFSSDYRSLPLTDENLQHMRGEWANVPFYGDYIIGLSGYHQVHHDYRFMCHSLKLIFKSGRTIKLESFPQPYPGSPFSINIPEYMLITEICFSNDATLSFLNIARTSIHLALSRRYRDMHRTYLPNECKDFLFFLLLLMHRLGITNDMRWEILSYMKGYELLDGILELGSRTNGVFQ